MRRFIGYFGLVTFGRGLVFIIDWLITVASKISAYAIFAMAFIVTGDVISRYLFNAPTTWAMESAGYLLVIAATCGLAYTLKIGGHIKIIILIQKLPIKVQGWLIVITSLIGIGYVFLLFHLTWTQFMLSFNANTTSGTTVDVIIWPLQLSIPVGVGLLGLALICKIIEETKTLLVNNSKNVDITRLEEGQGSEW